MSHRAGCGGVSAGTREATRASVATEVTGPPGPIRSAQLHIPDWFPSARQGETEVSVGSARAAYVTRVRPIVSKVAEFEQS